MNKYGELFALALVVAFAAVVCAIVYTTPSIASVPLQPKVVEVEIQDIGGGVIRIIDLTYSINCYSTGESISCQKL